MSGRLLERLFWLLNLRAGEARPVFLLLVFSFLQGLSQVFFETASMALYLDRWGGEEFLPFVYIGSAGLSLIIGFIYHRLEDRMSFSGLLTLTMGTLMVVVLVLRVGFAYYGYEHFWGGRGAAFVVVIWAEVLVMLNGIVFWNLAGRLLNLRQGKRLFGLASSGEVLSYIIGGVSIFYLGDFVPTPDILTLAAAAFGGCFLLMLVISRNFTVALSNPEEEEDEGGARGGRGPAARFRYLVLLFGMVSLSIFAYYYLDYAFLELVAIEYPDEASLTQFLGLFYAAVNVVNLLFKTLLSGRLMTRFGMTLGLLFLPVMVTSGIVAAVVVDFISGEVGVLIWVVVVVKLLDLVCRNSIDDSATVILYQPLPREQRLKMQTLVEGFAEPAATLVAATTLLILTSERMGFDASDLLFMILLMILGAWITTSVFLRRQYVEILSDALAKRALGGTNFLLNDASSLKLLEEKISVTNDNVGEVCYSVEMLEEGGAKQLIPKLGEMLGHPGEAVRLDMLERIERLGESSLAGAILKLLQTEKVARIRGAALRTLASFKEADVYEQLSPSLMSGELEVRRGAMVGLLRGGGIEGVMEAGGLLTQLAGSERAVERRFAAEVLGDVGIENFYRPLFKLMEDEDLEVRKAALVAAGKLGNPRLWPELVRALGVLPLKGVASSALVTAGDAVLPEMRDAFKKDFQTRDVRIRIVRICSQIRSEAAIRFLVEKVEYEDSQVRHQVLKSLNRLKFQAQSKEDQEQVSLALRKEVGNATWALACLVDLGALPASSLLMASLKVQLEDIREQLFLLLAMLYPHHSVMQIKDNYESGVDEKRAYAVELLDNMVRQDLKEIVLPLLEEIPDNQRLTRLSPHFSPARMTFHERLKNLIVSGIAQTSFWTVSCALYEVGATEDVDYEGAVATALNARDPIIRETALWSLGRLHPEDLSSRLEPFTTDPARNVAVMARYVMDTVVMGTVTTRSPYLRRAGQHEVKQLGAVLMNPAERPARRCQIVKVLALHRGSMAFKALIDGLFVADKQVQGAVLDALRRGGYDCGDRQGELLEILSREIADVEYLLVARRSLASVQGNERVLEGLEGGVLRARMRVLKALVLMDGDANYGELAYWYGSPGISYVPEKAQAQAVAMARTVVEESLSSKLQALFSRRQIQARHWPDSLPSSRPVDTVLADIALAQSRWFEPWLRVCALDRLVALGLSQHVNAIVGCLRDPNDVVRQAAIWALSRLAPAACQEHLRDLALDPSPLVAATVEELTHQMDDDGGPGDSEVVAPVGR